MAGNTRHLLFALQAVGSRDAVRPLVELVRANKVPAKGEEGVLTLIATLGSPHDLTLVAGRLLARETPASLRLGLLRALEESARQRQVKPEGDLSRLATLLQAKEGDSTEPVRAGAARLAGVWKLEALRPQLTALARAAETARVCVRQPWRGWLPWEGPPARRRSRR